MDGTPVTRMPCEVCGTPEENEDDMFHAIREGSAAHRLGFPLGERICGPCWQAMSELERARLDKNPFSNWKDLDDGTVLVGEWVWQVEPKSPPPPDHPHLRLLEPGRES